MSRPKTLLPLPDSAEKFLAEYGFHHPQKSAETYRNGLHRFFDSFDGEMKIEYFISFPTWLAKKKYKRTTRVLYMVAASVFWEWLLANEILLPTPAEMVRFKKAKELGRSRKDKKKIRNPSQDILDGLRDAVGRVRYFSPKSPARLRDMAIIEFLYSTGCRVGEVSSLKVCDVILSEKKATVTGKSDRERMVLLSTESVGKLQEYWTARGFSNPNDPAFSPHRNLIDNPRVHLTTQSLWQIVRKVMKIAGVPKREFTPHYFRHAFATRMLSVTQNLAVVQDLLGHEDPKTTRVYAKVSSVDMFEAHQKAYG